MIRIIFSLVCLMSASLAHADIYGYIDAQGTLHFADHPADARYTLFARTGERFENASPKQQAPLAAEADRPDGPASLTAQRSKFFQYVSEHPNVGKYATLIREVARESGVDAHLIQSVIAVESGYNPAAVSPKGAIGLMQIMPATGERYGARAESHRSLAQVLADPAINLRIGARYLSDLRKMFQQDLDLVLAAYNAGENAVKRYNNRIPPYAETQSYVRLVGQFYDFYRPDRATATSEEASAVAATNPMPLTTVRLTPLYASGRRNMPDLGRLPPGTVLKATAPTLRAVRLATDIADASASLADSIAEPLQP